MAHASDEYRYSTRDYRTQQMLVLALEEFAARHEWARANRELRKLQALLEKRKKGWR